MCTEEICLVTYSAVTVVNAIPSFKGAALSIEIPVRIYIKKLPRISQDLVYARDVEFIKFLIERFREVTDIRDRFKIIVKSDIPPGSGLKSSSSVSAGLVIGLAAISEINTSFLDCIRLSCTASREYGVSITGALDDATASVLGGLVYTDNRSQTLEEHVDVNEYMYSLVMIFKNWKRPQDFDKRINMLRNMSTIFEKLYNFAKKDPFNAAYVNAIYVSSVLGYSYDVITRIMREFKPSCVGLSGNGPAVFVIDSDLEKLKNIVKKYEQLLGFHKIVRVLPILREASMSVLDIRARR